MDLPLGDGLHSSETVRETVAVEQIAAAVDIVDIHCPEAVAGPEQVSSASDNRSGVAAGIVFAVQGIRMLDVKPELAAAGTVSAVLAMIWPGMRPEPAAAEVV